MKVDTSQESIRVVDGEPVMNTAALLRWLYELDLGAIPEPDKRAVIDRYQRLAKAVLAAEPITSARTVGQVLSESWGPPPVSVTQSSGVSAEDLFGWLDRKVVGLAG